jgi:hypothetical protein
VMDEVVDYRPHLRTGEVAQHCGRGRRTATGRPPRIRKQ